MVLNFIIALIVAYLLGSIPFGKIVARYFANVDITQHGSGNIGGTNVMRVLGLGPAALVIIGDIGKAYLSVLLARFFVTGNFSIFFGLLPEQTFFNAIAECSAALACMLGHNWSIYIKFAGGKGVACYFGGWLAMFPLLLGVGAICLIPTVIVTRHMSRGSIMAAVGCICSLIILTLLFNISAVYLIYSVVAGAIIIFQHRSNIRRIQQGVELKLDESIIKGTQVKNHNSRQR